MTTQIEPKKQDDSEAGERNIDDLGIIFEVISRKDWSAVSMLLEDVPTVASKICKFSQGISFVASSGGGKGNLALHEACKHQPTIKIVNSLLEVYKDAVKIPGQCAYLPLHYACSSGASREVISRLIEVYPAATRTRDELDDALPLHLAAKWGASSDVIMEILAAYPEGSFIRDASGKTPMDHAKKLPSGELQLSVVVALDSAPILVKTAKYASQRVANQYEDRMRGLKEAQAEYIRQLEQIHEADKLEFLRTEIDFQNMLAEEKERNIALSERLQELQLSEKNLKGELVEAHTTLAMERIEFRSKLEEQERDLRTIIDGAVGKVESLHEEVTDTKELKAMLSEFTKKYEESDKNLKEAKKDLQHRDDLINLLESSVLKKDERISELVKAIEEKGKDERVSQEKSKSLSTMNSGTQRELKIARAELDRFRKLIESQHKELVDLKKKLSSQEHGMGKIKKMVSNLAHQVHSWPNEDQFLTQNTIFEGIETLSKRDNGSLHLDVTARSIGVGPIIVTSVKGTSEHEKSGSGKSAEFTDDTCPEDEELTVSPLPSPARSSRSN